MAAIAEQHLPEPPGTSEHHPADPAALLVASGLAAGLAGCGGGAADGSIPINPVPVTPTRQQASRFLSQAGLGSGAADIDQVRQLGYAGWLDAQFALPRSSGYVDWLRSKGYDNPDNRNSFAGSNNMLWRKLIGSPDVLRQRMTLALTEIVVVSLNGLANLGFRSFSAAAYMDIVEAQAFGNFRTLLEQVSTSTAMGSYLTFRGNRKAQNGAVPDENYARELMQLFTIGLLELDIDGTPRRVNGQPVETYTQDDVSQLARVFTGWDQDTSVGTNDTPDRSIRPMVQVAGRHETGSKTFLGVNIPANTSAVDSLRIALDTLVAHPNVGPFVGRQLIQRLVTGNPSPAYVARVAKVFNDNGSGVKGDLKAVLRTILLDDEARSDRTLADPGFGKLREPLVRFLQWARTFGVTSPDDSWNIGDLSDPATRLGQSPLRSPTVFNFFRPGYVPPNSPLGDQNITAPEFQITTETSVAGYINFMQRTVSSNIGGLSGNYTGWLPLTANSQSLLDELNIVLAAGQIPAATLATLKTALDTIAISSPAGQNNRLYAALTMVLAAPEYITQK